MSVPPRTHAEILLRLTKAVGTLHNASVSMKHSFSFSFTPHGAISPPFHSLFLTWGLTPPNSFSPRGMKVVAATGTKKEDYG